MQSVTRAPPRPVTSVRPGLPAARHGRGIASPDITVCRGHLYTPSPHSARTFGLHLLGAKSGLEPHPWCYAVPTAISTSPGRRTVLPEGCGTSSPSGL